MPSGVYTRTDYHRKITSDGVKKLFKENPDKDKRWKKGNTPWNKNKILGKYSKNRCNNISQSLTGRSTHRKGLTMITEYGALKASKVKKKIHCKVKEIWQDEKYVRQQIKARNVKQNKLETFLEKYLNKILPNEYKFVGDGEFILGGKNPDYINTNGQKKLIELYGDYWHKGQNPQDRIDYFRKFGFDTLVIWESELENLCSVKNKILQFNNVKEGSTTIIQTSRNG